MNKNDPYAGIRNLKFRGVDEVFTPVSQDELSQFYVDTDEGRRVDQQRAIAAGFAPNAVSVGGSEYGGENFTWGRPTGQFRSWAPDWESLKSLGLQSKYNQSDDITSQLSEAQRTALGGDRLFKTTLQQPGKHKYDTQEAFYRVNPQGDAVLLGTPTASRQQSSSKQFRDTLFKEMLPVAAQIATFAGGLPGLSSTTFGGGLLGAAGAGAANSAIGTLLRGGGLDDILKSAVTGGVTGGVMPTISSAISDIIPREGVGSLFNRATTDVAQSGLRSLLSGGDFDLGEVLKGSALNQLTAGLTDNLGIPKGLASLGVRLAGGQQARPSDILGLVRGFGGPDNALAQVGRIADTVAGRKTRLPMSSTPPEALTQARATDDAFAPLALMSLLGQPARSAPAPEYEVAQINARSPFGSVFDRNRNEDTSQLLRGRYG